MLGFELSCEQSDADLLAAWRGGVQDAGQALFERYFDRVARFFAHKVHATEIDDLVQETFAACVSGRDRVREDGNFRAYVFGVAYNVLRVYLRNKRRPELPVDPQQWSVRDIGPSPSSWMQARQDEQMLRDGLRQLPLELQMVLELHYFEGLSSDEIARILHIPVGTVRGRMRRGRQQLRALILPLVNRTAGR